jgi:hypothetical protein
MFRSKDNLIRVEQINRISDVVFMPASWSMINLPLEPAQAENLFRNLLNTPTARHTTMVFNRQRKKDRLAATTNLQLIQRAGWTLLDTVTVLYEKTGTSTNSLVPVSEVAYIFHKGAQPDVKNTEWFSAGGSNASNLWNIAAQSDEPLKLTQLHKFSWELQLLMMSLCQPAEHNRFIYGLDLSESELESLFIFVNKYAVSVYLYAHTNSEAERIINSYHKWQKEKA